MFDTKNEALWVYVHSSHSILLHLHYKKSKYQVIEEDEMLRSCACEINWRRDY